MSLIDKGMSALPALQALCGDIRTGRVPAAVTGLGHIHKAVLAAARGKGSIQVRAYCDIRNEASHRLWLKNGFGISPAAQSDGSIPGSFVSFRL